MGYLSSRSSALTSPKQFLPDVASVAIFLIPYSSFPEIDDHEPRFGSARVARYAWGEDYHRVIKRQLNALVKDLGGEIQHRVFVDSAPIMERALGEASRLGFIGKNTLLITPRLGSFYFIASVFWNVNVEDSSSSILPDEIDRVSCGSCSACMDRCPTNAFVAPRVLDSRRCISYLTIERKTAFNRSEARMVGDWGFGCDICQQVCPYNNRGNSGQGWAEFGADIGVGPWIDLQEIFSIHDNDQFRERFAKTPLLRAGRECLIRNCAAVAANTKVLDAIEPLSRLAESDPSPYIRYHSRLALQSLN